jgi:hypothetical protein
MKTFKTYVFTLSEESSDSSNDSLEKSIDELLNQEFEDITIEGYVVANDRLIVTFSYKENED